MRIDSFDLARGFTVLFIAPVHAALLYAGPALYQHWLSDLLVFVAEGPGAPLFLLLMGLYVGLKPPARAGRVFGRSFGFLLGGTVLNFLKFGYWYGLGFLPLAYLPELGLKVASGQWVQILLMGDVLQFAAIVYPMLWGLRRIALPCYVTPLLAAAVAGCAPLLWDTHSAGFFDVVWTWCTGGPPGVYFPVFPWLAYPLLGLALGRLLAERGTAVFWRVCFFGGFTLLFAGALLSLREGGLLAGEFYRPLPGAVLVHAGFVLLWLSAWEGLARILPDNFFFRLLRESSRRITVVYAVQWILVCAFIPLIGFRSLGLAGSIWVMLAAGALSYGIAFILQPLSNKRYGTNEHYHL